MNYRILLIGFIICSTIAMAGRFTVVTKITKQIVDPNGVVIREHSVEMQDPSAAEKYMPDDYQLAKTITENMNDSLLWIFVAECVDYLNSRIEQYDIQLSVKKNND